MIAMSNGHQLCSLYLDERKKEKAELKGFSIEFGLVQLTNLFDFHLS